MKIEQIYTGCLAQGAYYIESNGEVAIIDPLREIEPYLKKAEKNDSKIKYIFETHFHADFVSGHVTLSKKTGAPIIYGPTAKTTFDSIIAHDGQEFKLGSVTIIALHTPGHTQESTTYLLKDEAGKDHAIFSGDTLFLGDVGRPDLAQKAADMTQDQLAAIIGHEVGHVIEHHSNERLSANKVSNVGMALAAIALGASDIENKDLWVAGLGIGVQYGVIMPYSRAHESEADIVGQDLMARSGFAP